LIPFRDGGKELRLRLWLLRPGSGPGRLRPLPAAGTVEGRGDRLKAARPKASVLKGSRVAFNIKGNDYWLVARLQYQTGVVAIRFFGIHTEYDRIDAETV
jgi:hypothetical protein